MSSKSRQNKSVTLSKKKNFPLCVCVCTDLSGINYPSPHSRQPHISQLLALYQLLLKSMCFIWYRRCLGVLFRLRTNRSSCADTVSVMEAGRLHDKRS
jgi:hypothetical protein